MSTGMEGMIADIGPMSGDWAKDCMKWRGRVLTGKKCHYCFDWDGLPVDETTPEFDACICYETVKGAKDAT